MFCKNILIHTYLMLNTIQYNNQNIILWYHKIVLIVCVTILSVKKTPGKIIVDHLEVAPVCDSHMSANPLALLL